ncbi:MAG: diaminopimelate decarboxylase [Proteobacteria bacterium]|nr:MAG: diaminopimelate decarboxylase [Pseudomonadota bacterium]PIE17884.1 MAG: diaminopimelate decarboxylase [Pseudomonadota bacterium]
MHHFHYHDGQLHCEDVPLARIAQEVGTPTYVYSRTTLNHHYRVFDEALAKSPHLICYSVKANPNGAVLGSLAKLGAGADIVSGGELMRALRAGIPGDRIVFSGVGKGADEMVEALDASILMFNVESVAELELLSAVAQDRGVLAPVALRVNPDVDPMTHPFIATGLRKSKFGIPLHHAWEAYQQALELPGIEIRGIDCHIGSQLTSVEPLLASMRKMYELVTKLRERDVELRYLDVGGGLGIVYSDETPPSPADYGNAVAGLLDELNRGSQGATDDLTVICEPGRVIMGNAGLLLGRVLYRKQNGQRQFVVVDTAMNDLLRPALYGAFHSIQPVKEQSAERMAFGLVDIVGPVCESADFMAKERPMPPLERDDLIAVMSCGAYGHGMASNYNSRRRPAEVLVEGDRYAVVRERESYEDLVRGESRPTWL